MALTIPSSERRAGPYEAAADQTDFDFSFPVLDAGDLVVTRARDGTVTTLALTTDYVVDDVGQQAGGKIVLQEGAEEGDVIVIEGDLDPERTSTFDGGKPLKSKELDPDFNRVVIMAQELLREANRAVRRSPLDTVGNALEIPHDKRGIFLGIDENGDLQGYSQTLFSGLEALKVQSVTADAAELEIDLAKGTYVILSLEATVTDLTIKNWAGNSVLGRLMLEVRQTGSFNISNWAGALWPDGAPNITDGDGSVDILLLHSPDGGGTVYGQVVGLGYS